MCECPIGWLVHFFIFISLSLSLSLITLSMPVARERFLDRGDRKYKISFVLPKNGQSFASTSNFNESKFLHNL